MAKGVFTHGIGAYIPPFPKEVKADFREGHGYRKDDLVRVLVFGGWAASLFFSGEPEGKRGTFMDLETKAVESASSVANVVDAYMGRVRDLKSRLQNDSASIKASAERIEKEMARVHQATSTAVNALISPEMERAIENAERLALALQSISETRESTVKFSVIEKSGVS